MAYVGVGPAAASTTASVDNYRDGWDQSEPGLSPANIGSSDFGQLFSTQLDGQVYAQPISVPTPSTPLGSTLIAVTENNTIYGLTPDTGEVLWSRHVGPTWPVSDIGCTDLSPNMGSTATPVYDPATDSIYFTSKVNDGADIKHPSWYMHSVDPASGTERPGWPVKIQGSPTNFPGVTFDPNFENQRAGLLLLDGVVYAAFGSICDLGPYRGYVVGVNASTPKQTTMWTTENAGTYSGGGIWQGGGGLTSDGDGRIYLSTGNGISPAPGAGTSPPGALAESVVRLQVNADQSLSAADYFSPANASDLDLNDNDLGSGGPVALPDDLVAKYPHLMVEQGKDGRVFLLNRDNLGGRAAGGSTGTDNVLAKVGPYQGLWGHPAVFGGDGGYIYTVGSAGPLRALKLGVDGSGNPTLSMAGTSALQQFGFSSGSPVVTSNGTDPNSAVVWVVYSTGSAGGNSELRAYSAIPDSTGTLQLLGTYPIGTAAKFVIAGTDSNRVFVGTRDGKVFGFGQPAASALSGPVTSFGPVETSTQSTKQVTLTASKALTINSISISNPMFTANTTATPLPVTLTPGGGNTYTFPVTFAPTAPGATSAILTANTSVGNFAVALEGTGIQNGLSASPKAVAFTGADPQPTGTTATVAVRIVNTGTADETISGSTVPGVGSPFSVTGMPGAGTVIHPGAGVDISVAYSPTVASPAGGDTGTVTITSDTGTASVALSGTAVVAQRGISVTPWPLDFGNVPVGTSVTKTFTVANTGNVSAALDKAKAPGGDFSTPAPINEGTVLGVGQTLDVTMTFTPSAVGSQSAAYEITPDTGQGAMYLPITGTGTTNPLVNRLAGLDRFLTGVQVSQAQWANAGGDASGRATAQQVVLARGDQFPDALAGVPLAAYVKGPLLLTDPTTLSKSTENEIVRILPKNSTVNILGGVGAVSDNVAKRLTQLGYKVTRFGGSDRYATALDIAEHGLPGSTHVIVATGLDYADALAAGPFAVGPASAGGVPAAVVLSNGTSMDAQTTQYVKVRAATSTQASPAVYAIGGLAATALHGIGGYVTSYYGGDRYQTDAKVVAAIAAAGPLTHLGIATGDGFADALTGGAFTATEGGAMVTIPSTLSPATVKLLNSLAPQLIGVTIFGGTAAISTAEAGQITTAVNGRTH